MIKRQHIEFELEALLLSKSYEDLIPKEKEFVLSQMTEEAYKSQQKILLASKASFQNPIPPLRVDIPSKAKSILTDRRKAQQPVQTFFANLATYRMPVWQAGLGMACMALLLLFSVNNKKTVIVPEEVFVYKTDTVYKSVPVNVAHQDKEVPIIVPPSKFKKVIAPQKRKAKRKSLIVEKQMNSSPTEQNYIVTTPSTNSMKQIEVPIVGMLADSIKAKATGRSIQKDPELTNFLVKVN